MKLHRSFSVAKADGIICTINAKSSCFPPMVGLKKSYRSTQEQQSRRELQGALRRFHSSGSAVRATPLAASTGGLSIEQCDLLIAMIVGGRIGIPEISFLWKPATTVFPRKESSNRWQRMNEDSAELLTA
ncbi:MAG: hypothetical protein ACK5OB_10830 [Pirellula sp.]|jgi:hypothetical protein